MIGKIFRGIKEILKLIMYLITAKIFSAIVIAIESELRKKVEYSSELTHSTSDTIVFLTNSYTYDIIIGISIMIVGAMIGYCVIKRRISKLIIISTFICIVVALIGLWGLGYSYINVTPDGFDIESPISKELAYKFKDIKEIHSYCERITSKYSTSYRFHYKLILSNGQTIELSKDIPDEEIYMLDKIHRILIDNYKIPYYSTGIKDPNYQNVLNSLDDENKKALKDIFEDRTSRLLIVK